MEERWIGEEPIRIATGNAQLTNIVSSPSKLVFTANSSDPSTIYQIKRNYFPAWSVSDETKKSYMTSPTQEGDISFAGQIGTHTYTVKMGSTPTETIANGVTLLTLALCLVLVFRRRI